MKTAIIGSRTAGAEHYNELVETAGRLGVTTIISGGAAGADTLARQLASETGRNLVEYLPDWKAHGRAAGPLRNARIIADAEQVIAIWDGKSKGTADSLKRARAAGLRVVVICV